MNWYTILGQRPDLAALDVNPPIGYIGHLIYPNERVFEPSGSGIGYQTVPTAPTAQVNLTAGTAPTVNLIAQGTFGYSCDDITARAGVSKKETIWLRSVDKADQVGGRAAKRGFMKCIEARALYQSVQVGSGIGAGSITTVQGDSILSKIAEAVDSIRLYPGEKTLVCSLKALNKLKGVAEVVERFKLFGYVAQGTAEEVRSLTHDALVTAMRGLFGVERILIADGTITLADAQITGVTGTTPIYGDSLLVVYAKPSEEDLSYKEVPELGKCFNFFPHDGDRIMIDTAPDPVRELNMYTASGSSDIVELNPAARCVINFATL